MATSVRVEGGERLAASLNELGNRAGDLRPGFDAVAGIISRAAQSDAPVRTGYLAGSVGPESTTGLARVVARARYAAPVIGGVPSRRMAGNPFMMRAARRSEPAWTAAYDRALQRACDDVRGA